MKKYISVCLAIVFCLSFSLSVSAAEENVYCYNGVEVVFEADSVLSESAKLSVAKMLVTGNFDSGDIKSYNLLCDAFGHKTTVETVETIQHKADDVEPRCLSQIWELTICERCETLVEETLLNQLYIYCCPEE